MIYLLMASIVWSFSWGLIKGQLVSLDPNYVASMRIIFAIPLFIPFFTIRGLKYTSILYLMLIGAIQYGCMYLLVIRSYHYLQAYQVVLFTACTPIYVTVIHDIWTGKFRPFFLLMAFVAWAAVATLYYKDIQSVDGLLTGFVLVQLADICFAFGQVAYKQFRKSNTHLSDKGIYMLLLVGGWVVTAIMTTYCNGWSSLFITTNVQWCTLVYLGIVATGMCFFWWNKGATQVNAGTLAVLNNLKIPLGILVSLVVFGEVADVKKLSLSIGLIVIAITLVETRRLKS